MGSRETIPPGTRLEHRVVQPELLDELPATDPRAIGSRRDLARVNWWMGHAKILATALRPFFDTRGAVRLVEIGSGDGAFLLSVVRRLPRPAQGRVILIDRQTGPDNRVRLALEQLGWEMEAVNSDAAAWMRLDGAPADVLLANLFLHHFDDRALRELLELVARHCRVFAACEPGRSRMSLAGVAMLWAIGCNDVTRHDARVSVEAGFSGRELTEAWPRWSGWTTVEHAVGLFSHLFVAHKSGAPAGPSAA